MFLPYSIVDVFSNTPYKGNPLAVVDNRTDSISKPQMQLMAQQFNLSETTFVCPSNDPASTFRLRSFLPNGEEVFGAGHNALGAWWLIMTSGWLSDSISESSAKAYHQELGDSVLPVEVSRAADNSVEISMRQGEPRFFDSHTDPDALASALGIHSSDIGFEHNGKQKTDTLVVTTSPARHLLVPVTNQETLHRVQFSNVEAIATELVKTHSTNSGIYAFTPIASTTTTPKFEARFFSPGMGAEDPATGSAAGPLGAYLWDAGVVGGGDSSEGIEIEVVQGRKRGRECVIRVSVQQEEGRMVGIAIRGTGALVAEGRIVVPSDGVLV